MHLRGVINKVSSPLYFLRLTDLEVHQIRICLFICLSQDHFLGGNVYFHQEINDVWLSIFMVLRLFSRFRCCPPDPSINKVGTMLFLMVFALLFSSNSMYSLSKHEVLCFIIIYLLPASQCLHLMSWELRTCFRVCF